MAFTEEEDGKVGDHGVFLLSYGVSALLCYPV